MAMSKTQFIQWRKAAKKPELTSAQLDGRYKAYVKRNGGTKAKAATVVNDRPDGWAKEGVKVTATNRHLYPASKWEVVGGQNGTRWARPRTELTGIDPELHGLVSTYDTDTNKQVGQMRRVYDALGTQLTQEAQASQARLGGLAELAGRSVPASYQSGAVTTPGGGMVQAPVQANANGADTAAIQQRMLLRDAALNVNTANLDAQQASQTGTRLVSKLEGERSKGRSDLLQSLVLKTREDAAAAREANLQLLGQQLDSDVASAKIASNEKIKAAEIESRERVAAGNQAAGVAKGQAAAAGKAAAAKKQSTAAYNKLKNQWIAKATGYVPFEDDGRGRERNYGNILSGTLGAKRKTVGGEPGTDKGLTTIDQFYNQATLAGVRPSDTVKMLLTAGVALSRSDVYNLLRRTLPDKNARAVTKQITGYDPPTSYGG